MAITAQSNITKTLAEVDSSSSKTLDENGLHISYSSNDQTKIFPAQNGEEFCKKSTQANASKLITSGFVVGDFVWGKIRNVFNDFSWWPGRIYHPSDASEYAAKYKSDNSSFLVAYFGDGSFSWCHPSQLKPFAVYFEDMSRQSKSKSFVNAVQEALDEISRLVRLKISCLCVPQNRADTQSVNAGIRPGAIPPDNDIGKEFIEQIKEPANLLAKVRSVAQLGNVDSLFEVALLKTWLTEFNCAKGYRALPDFQECKFIEGLEPEEESGVEEKSVIFKPMKLWIEVPFEVRGPSSSSPMRKNVSGTENGYGEGKRRKIKRSRYLSYPYTQFPKEVDDTIEESQRDYIGWKVENMLSMIRDDGIPSDIKTQLEDEMKDLLEMVQRI